MNFGDLVSGNLSDMVSLGRRIRRKLAKKKHGLPSISIGHDVLATTAVSYLAFDLLSQSYWRIDTGENLIAAALVAAISIVIYSAFRLHKQVWRYISVNDLPRIALASAIVVAATSIVLFLSGLPKPNTSSFAFAILAHWIAVCGALVVGRFAWRFLLDVVSPLDAKVDATKKALLFHAGPECNLMIRGLEISKNRGFQPVGIIDHREEYFGRTVRGVPVLGDLSRLSGVVRALEIAGQRPEEIILTRKPSEVELLALLKVAKDCKLRLSALHSPSATSAIVKGKRLAIDSSVLQAIAGRAAIELEEKTISNLIKGQRILVTGAGGSIGSELVKLIATLGPSRIDVIDNCEYNLWKIEQTLKNFFSNVRFRARIADIRDGDRLKTLFKSARPDLVFHAAALKHVPIVEVNATEGVLSNAIGTRNVAQAVLASGAKAMVQISTDKAVNPSSVMGATKRLAELYCQALDLEQKGARFMTVRFGNVLGSSGSVVPVFQKQIEAGGPISITHPDMTRYFMTISEACELVLHAAAHGIDDRDSLGVINVLDMGDPVAIIDIARQLIILNGKRPEEDIRIETIGIRPGEKLSEELFDTTEVRLEGPVAGVLAARSVGIQFREIAATIDGLERLTQIGGDGAISLALQSSVPGYASQIARLADQVAA